MIHEIENTSCVKSKVTVTSGEWNCDHEIKWPDNTSSYNRGYSILTFPVQSRTGMRRCSVLLSQQPVLACSPWLRYPRSWQGEADLQSPAPDVDIPEPGQTHT